MSWKGLVQHRKAGKDRARSGGVRGCGWRAGCPEANERRLWEPKAGRRNSGVLAREGTGMGSSDCLLYTVEIYLGIQAPCWDGWIFLIDAGDGSPETMREQGGADV